MMMRTYFRTPAGFALAALFVPALCGAQTHRVAKTEAVTRAVGVYEWTGDLAKPTAARLVPVSLFIDGRLEDAGTYLARPIPLALLDGNVYELQRAGQPQGTLTLAYARHLQAATGSAENLTDFGWFGYGRYAAAPAEKQNPKPLQATTVHPIVSSKDDAATFARKTADTTTDSSDRTAKKRGSSKDTDHASVTGDAAPQDDPDRPTLSKKAPPASSDGTVAGDVDGGGSAKPKDPNAPERTTDTVSKTPPEDDADRPTLRHRDPKQAAADRKAREHGSVSALGTGPDSDPDRPAMRRGVAGGLEAPATQLTGLPKDLHQEVAVSDAAGREAHVFARTWESAAEKDAVETQMLKLGQDFVAAYVKANGMAPLPTPTPRAAHGARRAAETPAPPRAFALHQFPQHQVDGYQLEYGGLPTFVLQGVTEAQATGPATAQPMLVTVVAQRLPSGELQVAFSSVTDGAHLDRTPQFRLVGAVDPDATHRASLIFELRGQTSRQFALYRLTGAKADQIFVTRATE